MAEETLKDRIMMGVIAAIIFIVAGPFMYLFLFIKWIVDIYRIGWRLAWMKYFNTKVFDKFERIKKARERRIDKELNGWPTDPVERAKCPKLKMRLDNQYEGNGYIDGTIHSLIYVANESCPELEELLRTHIDELNQFLKPLEFTVYYLPALLDSLNDKEVHKYMIPWTDDITTEDIHIGNDYMFQFLIHPEDRNQMKHGFIFCQTEIRTDHYVETYIYHYYELLPPSEADWDEQLKALRRRLGQEAFWLQLALYSKMEDSAGEEDENFADNAFNSQEWSENIDDLMDEIRVKLEVLRKRGVAQHILEQLIRPTEKISKLLITKDYRLILPDYQNMEIKMEPLAKAVYLMFLNHPEGIMFKELPAYRKELTEIYLKLKPNGLTERVQQSIEDVTNPLLNSINEKCARIRGAFVGQFDDYLAKYYYIDGLRAKPKKISLSRELVVWE